MKWMEIQHDVLFTKDKREGILKFEDAFPFSLFRIKCAL